MLRDTIEHLCASGKIEPFQRLPLTRLSSVQWDDPALGARLLPVHMDGNTDQASRGPVLRIAVENWISAVAGDLERHSVLDLYCGTGSLANCSRTRRYVGVEVNPVLADAARKLHRAGANFICDDALAYVHVANLSKVSLVLVLYECLNGLGTTAAYELLRLMNRMCSPGTWLIGDVRLRGSGWGRQCISASGCIYFAPSEADLVIDESGYTDDGVYFGHRYVALAAGAVTESVHSFIELFSADGVTELLKSTGWQPRTSQLVLSGLPTDVEECADNLFFAAIASAS